MTIETRRQLFEDGATHNPPERKNYEPFFWSLFSAGGMITALVAPALIVITGFLVPADEIEFSRLDAILTNPIGRVVVFAVIALTFFHAAHRLRHTLIEMGLKRIAGPLAVLSYGSALAGSVLAGVVAFS